MIKDETAIEHCRRCVAEEQKLGHKAPTQEAGERHYQLAMLYKAQLAVLERRQRARPHAEMFHSGQAL